MPDRDGTAHGRGVMVLTGACLIAALPGGCGKYQPLSLPQGSSASAQGIWLGMDATAQQVTGLIDSNQQADFIRADGTQFIGSVTLSGTSMSAALSGYSQFNTRTGSGVPPSGTGSFSGTLSTGKSISGTLTYTPKGGSSTTSNWSLTFSSLYNNASSLTLVSGTYGDTGAAVSTGVDPLQGASVSISTSGQMSGQNPNNDCVLNGTVSIDDAGHDLYRVSYTLANCVNTLNGQFQLLNGVSFTGLADLNASVSPHQLLLAVTGQDSGGDRFGIVSQLTD
jgi:hypothetical protein